MSKLHDKPKYCMFQKSIHTIKINRPCHFLQFGYMACLSSILCREGVGGIDVASGRTSWHMRRWPISQFRIQRGRMVNEQHGQSCLLTCTVNSIHFNHQPRMWRSPYRDPAKPMSLSTRAETCYMRVINH